MRIGILAHDFITWGGGVDFLRTVVDSAVTSDRARGAEFHLLVPDSGPRLKWRRARRRIKQAFKSLGGKKASEQHAPPADLLSESFAEFRNRVALEHIDVGRNAVIRAAKRLKLDVVVPAVHSLGADFPLPWVAYAYDFQHKYFPQNFPPEDCRSRDEHFGELLTQAKAAIVNSRAAASDIAKFVPQATARIFALPFAPSPNPEWLNERAGVLERYAVTAPYFIISNQFWAHKGHATAFEAFRTVAGENPKAELVCTGSTAGSRDPAYFTGLVDKLKEWKLDHRVRILGLIPKRDQIELMKNALAVIQPTLFEGGPGGGAVYDAMSLDVPAIVSDIPVNRELDSGTIDFFPANNAAELAEKMKIRLVTPHSRAPDNELLLRGRRRRAACGDVLWSAIDFVL